MVRLNVSSRVAYRDCLLDDEGEEICLMFSAVDSEGNHCSGMAAIWLDVSTAKSMILEVSNMLVVNDRSK